MAAQTSQWGTTSTEPGPAYLADEEREEKGAFEGIVDRALGICGEACALAQERPVLMLGLLSAIVGTLLGGWLATRGARPKAAVPLPEMPDPSELRRIARRTGADARDVAEAGTGRARDQLQAGLALVPVLLRLLANPLVQGYLRKALAQRLGR